MKLAFLSLIGMLLLSNCTKKVKQLDLVPDLTDNFTVPLDTDSSGIPNQELRLWHTLDQFDLEDFEFYGDFYDNRLKFYYSSSPGTTIGPYRIQLLMLYFLDDRLVKIRYHLDEDISAYLTDSLGVGLLKNKYTQGKKVMATKRSIQKLRDFYAEKGQNGVYDIAWDRYVIESSFHIDFRSVNTFSFDTLSSRYVYIDQLKSYKHRLMEIENESARKRMSRNSIP